MQLGQWAKVDFASAVQTAASARGTQLEIWRPCWGQGGGSHKNNSLPLPTMRPKELDKQKYEDKLGGDSI